MHEPLVLMFFPSLDAQVSDAEFLCPERNKPCEFLFLNSKTRKREIYIAQTIGLHIKKTKFYELNFRKFSCPLISRMTRILIREMTSNLMKKKLKAMISASVNNHPTAPPSSR